VSQLRNADWGLEDSLLFNPQSEIRIPQSKGGIEMADEDRSENREGGQGGTPKESKTGDPGRTPGKAEGDEETVDESLREKEKKPLH
jgi:hypothetical protein